MDTTKIKNGSEQDKIIVQEADVQHNKQDKQQQRLKPSPDNK